MLRCILSAVSAPGRNCAFLSKTKVSSIKNLPDNSNLFHAVIIAQHHTLDNRINVKNYLGTIDKQIFL